MTPFGPLMVATDSKRPSELGSTMCFMISRMLPTGAADGAAATGRLAATRYVAVEEMSATTTAIAKACALDMNAPHCKSDVSEAEVLHLEELLDPVLGALAT